MKKGANTPEALVARERARAWALANPARARLNKRKWDKAHRDQKLAAQRAWRESNKEELRAKASEKQKQHPEIARNRVAQWREANPDKFKQQYTVWRKANPEKVIAAARKHREANRDAYTALQNARHARKRLAPGAGISQSERKSILAGLLGLCAYCQRHCTLTLDHIEPLVLGGAHDPENMAPACKSCNSSKNDTPLVLWLVKRKAA